MSEAVSALDGASFSGIAQIEETGLQGMITLRGDLASAAVKKAATAASGAPMPAKLGVAFNGTGALAWMSPDELLVLCPYGEVRDRLAAMERALAKSHSLAVDVSDARAAFRVSGEGAREVLAKLCPVDFAAASFTPGQFRRTRMAQVPAAIWCEADDRFGVICFRSVAGYVFGVLKAAAAKGSTVGMF